jgi:hypothetical protein
MSAGRDILALSASVLTDADRELHSRARSERRHGIGAQNFGNADRHRQTTRLADFVVFRPRPAGIRFRSSAVETAFAAASRLPPLNYGSLSRTA